MAVLKLNETNVIDKPAYIKHKNTCVCDVGLIIPLT